MRKTSFLFSACLFIGLTAPSMAQAVLYNQVITEKSAIGVVFTQMGVSMDGKFTRFKSSLSFDSTKPAASRVTMDVELSSFNTGTDLDPEAAGKAWFNTAAFPVARFVSSGVKPAGNNRFDVSGKLTIKGKTSDITFPASFKAQADAGLFEGKFAIKRSDFNVGEGAWSKFDVVANEVVIQFRIHASAKK